MSTKNISIAGLLKKQEAERQDLAAGVYQEWQALRQRETQILSLYNGNTEILPAPIQEKLEQKREAFFQEWGSEGRLAALMAERHTKERESVIKQEQQEERYVNKNQKHDRGR